LRLISQDILKANDVKATFFIRTYNLYADLVFHRSEGLPALVRRMYNEGHQIAGHTWEHKNMDTQLDSQQRRDEMTKQEMALNDILGFFPTYMRPPFNKCSAACKADMLELGYHIVSTQDAVGAKEKRDYTNYCCPRLDVTSTDETGLEITHTRGNALLRR
jgi:peptidoglycan/xylan/chitin deacetylase (PgdA/CDA1 family)